MKCVCLCAVVRRSNLFLGDAESCCLAQGLRSVAGEVLYSVHFDSEQAHGGGGELAPLKNTHNALSGVGRERQPLSGET